MTTTPVAVFTYNRPVHTRQLLESLAACYRLDECRVVIFSDGLKTPDHERSVRDTRAVVQAWAKRHAAEVVEHRENQGLARSITGGVTDLCNEYGRVIVVEDDLVLRPAFIHFMLSALDRYAGDERIGQISGYMYPIHYLKTTDAFFLPYTTSWGWATWEYAWKLYSDAPDISALDDPQVQFDFNQSGTTQHVTILRQRMENHNQSWAILFYWAIFCHKKLVLHTRIPLVRNVGFDGGGTHYRRRLSISKRFSVIIQNILSAQLAYRANWRANTEFVWPTNVEIDLNAYEMVRAYRRKLMMRNR